MASCCLLKTIVLLLPWLITAEYMEGDINLLADEGWSFLGHWMFGHNPGNATKDSYKTDRYRAGELTVTLRLNKPLVEPTTFWLALYDDQVTSWPALLSNKSNGCTDTDSGGHIDMNMARDRMKVDFTTDHLDGGINGSDVFGATIYIHEHIVPRWWWLFLVKCDFGSTAVQDFIGHDVHYKVHWTQFDELRWNEELSLNQYHQNSFHCVAPWFTLCLLLAQCASYGMYWKQPPKGYVHPIIRWLTLLIFLEFVAQIFKMAYWLHLTYSGWKEYGVLTFSFLFEVSANVLFLYLLTAMLGFGWRMSVSKLNKKLNWALLAVCVLIEIFELTMFIWSWQWYPNQEDTLYRYTEKPQIAYGVFMLCFGILFFGLLLFGACRDSLNGIITATQRNSRILMGFVLFWTWFVWPIFAVAVAATFEMWRVDCGCDVLSWMMKMVSLGLVVVMVHPLNPHHDRCFDFGRQFVFARYVQNGPHHGIFDESDDDEDDTPKTEIAMKEIKGSGHSTATHSKFGGKGGGKKGNKKGPKRKLFEYGQRVNAVAVDSEEEDESESGSSDEDSDDDDAGNGHIRVHAVSIDAAKETLRSGGE